MVSDPNHTYAGFCNRLGANDLSYDDVINAQRIAVVHFGGMLVIDGLTGLWQCVMPVRYLIRN